jgi:hypothetical protein
MHRIIGAAIIVLVGVSFVTAEEFFGVITKVDGNKLSITKFKKGDKKGEESTLTVADTVKVVKGKFNKDTKKVEAGDSIEGGLKSDVFSNIGEKGVAATIVTDDNKKITEIRIFRGKKKN